MSDWTDPAWRAEADAWIGEQLAARSEPTGELDQMHVRPWSTVMRVPTTRGDVFFKAVAPPLRHEAALVALSRRDGPTASRRSSRSTPSRGWMLMGDAGTKLRELIESERELRRWRDVLPLYAGVQIDLIGRRRRARRARRPRPPARDAARAGRGAARRDRGLEPDEQRRRRRRCPGFASSCAELASFGIPETIQHDDLHDAQVFVRDGRYLLLDWGDACVSHPFFTLAVTLDGVIAWGVDDVEDSEPTEPYRDAYLEPFAAAEATTSRRRLDDRATARLALPRGQQLPRAVRDEQTGSAAAGCSSTGPRSGPSRGARRRRGTRAARD